MVRCSGRLMIGSTDQLLLPVKELIPQYKCIVLDFTDLVRMDSSGLGTVVRLYVSAKSAGCLIQLKNVRTADQEAAGHHQLMVGIDRDR